MARPTKEEFRANIDAAALKKMAAVFQKSNDEIAQKLLEEKEAENEKIEKEHREKKEVNKKAATGTKNLTDKQKKELKKLEIEQADKERQELYDSRLLQTPKGGKIKWARSGLSFVGSYKDKVVFKIKPGIMSYGLYKDGKYVGSSSFLIKLKEKSEKLL